MESLTCPENPFVIRCELECCLPTRPSCPFCCIASAAPENLWDPVNDPKLAGILHCRGDSAIVMWKDGEFPYFSLETVQRGMSTKMDILLDAYTLFGSNQVDWKTNTMMYWNHRTGAPVTMSTFDLMKVKLLNQVSQVV